MNKVSKDLDVMIIGAAIVDLPLRPVSKEVFDVVSYPVDGIAMTIGGDALNESTIITRLGHKVALMSCIGVDVARNRYKIYQTRSGNRYFDQCRSGSG